MKTMYVFHFFYDTENVLIVAENKKNAIEIANNRMDFNRVDFDVDPYRIECLGSADCTDIIERFPKNEKSNSTFALCIWSIVCFLVLVNFCLIVVRFHPFGTIGRIFYLW